MSPSDPYLRREQFTDVREELRKWLADEGKEQRISERVWDRLLDEPDLLRSARKEGMARLAQRYLLDLKHYGPRRHEARQEPEIGPDARSAALSEIATIGAMAESFGVGAFRRRHLGGRLLPMTAIADWIDEQAKLEGSPAKAYLLIPLTEISAQPMPPHMSTDAVAEYAHWLSAEVERVRRDPHAEVPQGKWEGAAELVYGNPGERPKRALIRRDGALAALKGVVARLQSKIPWSEAEAVAFVLSGWSPTLPRARGRVSFVNGLYPALSRIGLEVDPRVTPRDIASLYQKVRREFARGRDRPMDDKHLELALFAERTRHESASWTDLRERWNSTARKDWAFDEDVDPYAKRFALECRSAWSRVTGQKWSRHPASAPGRDEEAALPPIDTDDQEEA